MINSNASNQINCTFQIIKFYAIAFAIAWKWRLEVVSRYKYTLSKLNRLTED